MRHRVMLFGLVLPALLLAQQPEQLPRFRAGANLVRVDTYVSKDSVALLDLKAEDFNVFEDDKPQKVESFELIQARTANPQTERIEATNVSDMNQQAANATRLFTLFFDRWHVQLAGSFRARKPIIDTLDRVIGPDDLVGVMTPEMSPGAITYSRRTGSIEREVTDNWTWGVKNSNYRSPREDAIIGCYATTPAARDIAPKMIARLREEETLNSLDALVTHLEALRPERKFVMVFTEGWPLFRPDDTLSRSIEGQVPGQDPVRVNPLTGGLTKQGEGDPRTGQAMTYEACERLRTMLAYSDHETVFRQLLQRANRANVSFYPIDARGLIVFDTPIELGVPPYADQAWMTKRFEDLRSMALQTDGEAVLNVSDVAKSMQKIFADVGSYYLLGYYSTNSKLDGRFRRIRVEVKREGVDVRSRPGYLAPTEAEARASGVAITRPGAKPGPPPTVTRALDALAPARGNLPVRVQAVGGRSSIRAIVEIDPATAKQPEWLSGGTLRLTFEPERVTGSSSVGQPQTLTKAIDPGQRSIVISGSEQPLAAGRYAVRAELTPRNGRLPLQVTTFATVPAEAAEVGTGGLAARRGPSTGLVYVATADPRFRRTERFRLEVPLASEGFTGTGRLLTRDGQATQLIVAFSTRTDEATKQQFGVADVTLAPLAEGEYVVELSLTKAGKTETVTYGFRIVS
jgi:VWFA-related protein